MEAGMMTGGFQSGIINQFRTGNLVFDMIIACMIPLLIAKIMSTYENFPVDGILDRIKTFFWPGSVYYERTISHEVSGREDNGMDERNHILIKSLAMFMNTLKENIDYSSADLCLMSVKEKIGFDQTQYTTVYGSTVDQLACYDIVTKASEDIWFVIKSPFGKNDSKYADVNLEFKITNTTSEEGKSRYAVVTKKMHYTFRSNETNGNEIIDKFVNDAYDWYMDKMLKNTDNSKYMYVMNNLKKDDDYGNTEAITPCRRYKLSNRKDFNSLFFTEKDTLIDILDTFSKKSGKYAIPGYPHKLGLLLHGPPGTGKTSLIKALACHLNRNIVSVPLAKIETNQQLMDIMFDQNFKVPEEDLPVKLQFKDTIFVMEDIDCASNVVHRRTGANAVPADSVQKSSPAVTMKAKDKVALAAHIASASQEKLKEKKQKKQDSEKSDDDSENDSEKDDLLGDIIETDPEDNETENIPADAGGRDETMELSDILDMMGPNPKPAYGKFNAVDKLNLQGLLEVMDGVLDAEDRIVVMTTNHPEKLDPALIRPGRVDKILKLSYLNGESACKLVKHYFGKCTYPEKVISMFENSTKTMTPAKMEQIAVEHPDEDSFIIGLAERLIHQGVGRQNTIDLLNSKNY